MNQYDIAIIGAGIAGAGMAAELAPHAKVVLLETEAQPGYHSTGRSAAFWSETYGGPRIQPLTSASGPALRDGGFLEPLGSLHIGRAEDRAKVEAMQAEFDGSGVPLKIVDPAAFIPGLKSGWTLGLLEATCAYIDVGGLHGSFLATAKRAGATLLCEAQVRGAAHEGGKWKIDTAQGQVEAGIVVNAAGAWADPVAALFGARRLGIQPYRRTLMQLRTDPAVPHGMPHVADIGGNFYFKPEAGGKLWLSPHDETPVPASDVAAEELDVAIGIDRLEQVVDWRIAAVERKWAGLRSFAPDRLPVYGFDSVAAGFFWCAGQGGFGIQTAPAAAMLAASLLLGRTPDPLVRDIDPAAYAPQRFSA